MDGEPCRFGGLHKARGRPPGREVGAFICRPRSVEPGSPSSSWRRPPVDPREELGAGRGQPRRPTAAPWGHGMSDPTVPPELAELRERVPRLRARRRDPGGGRARARARRRDGAPRELQGRPPTPDCFAPHVAGVGGLGLDMSARPSCSRRPATACSARSRSTAPRRTRATCTCSSVIATGAAGALPAAARRRRDPLVLRDDRAGARRRLRPGDAADAATRVDGGWRIDGRKWFITGAAGPASRS